MEESNTEIPLEAAIRYFGSQPVSFLRTVVSRPGYGDHPLTNVVIVVTTTFFILELVLTLQYGAGSPYNLVSFFFKEHPILAWPFAPFLHRGVGHFAANVMFLYLAAPTECSMSLRQYLGLLALGGFVPVYADGAKLAMLGDEPHVAAYGASAFVFALIGYGAVICIQSEWRLTPRWWVITSLGVSSVVLIALNVISAVSNPIILNIGHLGGFAVGIAAAYLSGRG